MQKSVSIRQIATTNSSNRDTFVRIETPFYIYYYYLRTRKSKTIIMNIIDFFQDAPVLATIISLAYVVIVGVFVYILIQMYKK